MGNTVDWQFPEGNSLYTYTRYTPWHFSHLSLPLFFLTFFLYFLFFCLNHPVRA
ncbi:hypothetical protein BCR43DRAFT_488911 [Syncephalastrum racemosum]|uniref:Uncharacterized protein n=1 Tax=Syncephalastrum racemosum TaxID=13706 RepID=A0A1X2HJE2_SYNRA|nr:hypothetical protein BCR43DRAFT_488911 [Syncephalastrum racemosum]